MGRLSAESGERVELPPGTCVSERKRRNMLGALGAASSDLHWCNDGSRNVSSTWRRWRHYHRRILAQTSEEYRGDHASADSRCPRHRWSETRSNALESTWIQRNAQQYALCARLIVCVLTMIARWRRRQKTLCCNGVRSGAEVRHAHRLIIGATTGNLVQRI
jgi:hypothetical protein